MDNTVKGEIKTAIDGFIKYDDDDESGNINFTKMINKAIKKDRNYILLTFWTHLFFFPYRGHNFFWIIYIFFNIYIL